MRIGAVLSSLEDSQTVSLTGNGATATYTLCESALDQLKMKVIRRGLSLADALGVG